MSLPDTWIPVSIPAEFVAGPKNFANLANWVIKPRSDGRWNVTLRENYENRNPIAFRLERVAGAAQSTEKQRYQMFEQWRGTGHDRVTAGKPRALGEQRMAELDKLANRVAVWESFDLGNLIATDAELPAYLQVAFSAIAKQIPTSSLWMATTDPAFFARKAAVRALLAAQEGPELLQRDQKDIGGFEAGRGLESTDGLGVAPLVQTGLLAAAPGILGTVSARWPGMVILLFGHFESGREQEQAAELIDLFRPRLLSSPVPDVLQMPRITAEESEKYLKWWVNQLNELMTVVVDPALFFRNDETPDGSYDAARHFGFQLSVDRLFATIKGMLIASRRDEFTRMIFAFQAFDLLKGMRLGDYGRLADPGRVREDVDALKTILPPEVAKVILPRCERAADALAKLRDGFYLRERLTQDGRLRIRTRAGAWETIGVDRAVAEYVNLVRDAGHSLWEKMRDPRESSLFVSHDGQLLPEVADVPFIHVVRLLAEPTLVRQRLRPTTLRPASAKST